MSSMKGGFSTLNRWFGRKKDKTGITSNGKLSKSTTQLHHLSTDTGMHINEASQLDYNRITPLPAATSNAPFEQTFRITVLLPKDQLYVTRLGARVPLSKLLSLVCDNKQLDADKYEFRNPVDASQVYSCELTIGAVGLSEIRLCHKSESYDSFNADSMLKFQRTAGTRDSLSSSSDFSSSRHSHSKLTAKTPSPYSSSNSLNSMDSTGMNYTRTPVVPPKTLAPPPRKKRVAPRPPSQLAIPEQSVPQFTPTSMATPTEPAYAVIVKRPQLCMSTPNLASTPELDMEKEKEKEKDRDNIKEKDNVKESAVQLDCNGNNAKTPDAVDNGSHYATLELKSNSVSLPEPTPRKRLLQIKKKAAPAPPPESPLASAPAADNISLASTTVSITETLPVTPQPAPRITTPTPTPAPMATPTPTPPPMATPTPIASQTPLVRSAPMEELPQTPIPPLPETAAPQMPNNGNQNVSKVLLNRTPTPEPRSLSSNTEEEDNNDAASKQADSGIGEPAPSPSPMPSASPSPEPQLEQEAEPKGHIDSSSEDDDAIKVYNFATSVQSCIKQQSTEPMKPTTLAELTVLTATDNDADDDDLGSEEQPSPANSGAQTTPGSASELTSLSSWNYAVPPISPPPDFSDFTQTQRNKGTAGSPLDEIVDELSSIINQQRLDTLIRQAPEQPQIEAAKPNRLTNFSIAAISNGNANTTTSTTSISTSTTTRTYSSNSTSSSKHNSPTITRADSFQAVSQSPRNSLGLRLRSSSQLSLNKLEHNGNGNGNGNGIGALTQRRSSSELSIAESPSLQSLELIKTILSNSRKNSLVDSLDQQQSEKPKISSPIVAANELMTQPAAVTPSPPPTASVRSSPATESSIASPQPEQQTLPPQQSLSVATPTTAVASPSQSNASSPAATPEPRIMANPAPAPAPKPLPPTYRYSGPPSINFATWSERPKSQVAIKNEGDYIYGGANAAAASKVPSPAPAPTKLTIEVASPILRMGIPRKEYHVPITVKPLRDDSEEQEVKQEQQPVKQQEKQQEPKQQERQLTAAEPEPLREFNVKPSTLPRPAKSNRYTLPAGGGAINAITINGTNTSTNSLPRPVSTLERTVKMTSMPTAEPVSAPFGQNTLRRTGFKERMLAKEEQEKEQALRVRVSVNGTSAPAVAMTGTQATPATPAIPATPTNTPTTPIPTATPTFTSAAAANVAAAVTVKPTQTTKTIIRPNKLELKLPQPQPNAEVEPMLQVKLRATSNGISTRQSMPSNITTTTTTTPPPPPPPALTKVTTTTKRSVNNNMTPTTPDPRSQLLDAIRNFKREELNRA